MKKCNLKSPFYYHRRGFVIENKTDFNRSPCFMIIFIHVEGLFGLGRIHIILYTSHVCVRHGRYYFNRSIINSFGYLDEIFPTTNRCRPQRRRHIGFSIFWHATPPVQLSAYMSGDFQNEKYRSRGANSPQNKHRTRTRACAHHWMRIHIYSSDNERIYLRTIIRPLVTNSPRRPW